MKKMKLWMMAAILFCGFTCVTSCNGNAGTDKAEKETASIELDETVTSVIDKYLIDSIGKHYAGNGMCIPAVSYQTNEMTNDSLFVWGDYWVFKYNIVGDTLKCASGGSHPGKMLLLKNNKGEYKVVSFEQVEDGHGNMESAKRIFGKYYDDFHAANSDENHREEVRAAAIADFVKAKKLHVKHYQDYGWPAKKIPVDTVSAK
ncbi:MAG: hypothetical protein IJG42_01960 [Muribaculaceae bacterium]|nr:hypothetical protein [Muribaculaceae bacterium]